MNHHLQTLRGVPYVLLLVLILAAESLGTARSPTAAGQTPATPSADTWAGLRRPLRLPILADGAPCPRSAGQFVSPNVGVALGDGPVYATLPFIGAINLDPQTPLIGTNVEGTWYGTKAIWYIGPPESEQPVLIRGGQIDGVGEVRFVGGQPTDLRTELRLFGVGGVSADAPGWNLWTSGVYVQVPGCYAYQLDRADLSQVVIFEAVDGRPGALTPLPPFQTLPRDLNVTAGVETGEDNVLLALRGAQGLAIRLNVAPTRSTPLEFSNPAMKRLETSGGPVLWTPNPEVGSPRIAVWDDGRRRYQLEVLDGAEPGLWTESDLLALVEAFAAAPEDEATPPSNG